MACDTSPLTRPEFPDGVAAEIPYILVADFTIYGPSGGILETTRNRPYSTLYMLDANPHVLNLVAPGTVGMKAGGRRQLVGPIPLLDVDR